MSSPAKPFACTAPDCGHTFTNEEKLTVHCKKHEMALLLGQKVNAFPADQTPTPTRFIRNCEEVGLFQELQNVNPFDEGFKRAMEAEGGILISLDNAIAAATSDDALHTPHIFPNLADVPDSGLFTTSTKKHTVTRSSSDESTTVKHFETIQTKLTNEVIIETHNKNGPPNNKITIQSNIALHKADFSTIVDNDPNLSKVDKDLNVGRKDVLLADTGKNPVMSQQSLDFAIDSLTSHVDDMKNKQMQIVKNIALIDTMKKNVKSALENASKNCSQTILIEDKNEEKVEKKRKGRQRRSLDLSKIKTNSHVKTINDNYQVMLRLPNGELVHMKSSEEIKPTTDTKQKLKDAIENKIKAEIETKIRTELEKKIKSEILLNVMDPKGNIAVTPSYALPYPVALITTIPKNFTVTSRKIGIPQVHYTDKKPRNAIGKTATAKLLHQPNVANPVVNYANKSSDKEPRKIDEKSALVKLMPKPNVANMLPDKEPINIVDNSGLVKLLPKPNLVKTVCHKPNCDILTKVGCQCNLNCAEEVNPNRPQHVENLVFTLAPSVMVANNIDKNNVNLNSNLDKDNSKNNSEISDNRISTSNLPVIVIRYGPKVSTNHTASVINDCKTHSKPTHSSDVIVPDNHKKIDQTAPPLAVVNRSLLKRKNQFRIQDNETFKRISRQEAVRRYRARQKDKFETISEQNKRLSLENGRLSKELDRTRRELAELKCAYMEHNQSCGKAQGLETEYGMFVGNFKFTGGPAINEDARRKFGHIIENDDLSYKSSHL